MIPIQTNESSLVRLNGLAIRLSDVRGFIIEDETRKVVLANGMKLSISAIDRERLQDALNATSRKIIKDVRTTGIL